VIPFGASGYVALFKIEASDSLVIAATRHQREDDYLTLRNLPDSRRSPVEPSQWRAKAQPCKGPR
jgi:hypothetical protein